MGITFLFFTYKNINFKLFYLYDLFKYLKMLYTITNLQTVI
jgi:hypothetical protein